MPVVPFIPLIAAGVGGAFGLAGAKSASKTAKAQQAALNPLIQQQTESSKWSLDQAKMDIPKARETLGGPLAFWNKILSGDRNAAMAVAGPSADQIAGQTAAANRTQAEFSPRGGRRALMLGDRPLETTTSLNRGLLELRPRAAEETKSLGQILAQLGLGEVGASTTAGDSAISGQLGAAKLENQSNAITSDAYKGVGASIGNALLSLQKIYNDKKGGGEGGAMSGQGGWGGIFGNHGYDPEHPTNA